jgi:hypothetical protein
MRKPSQNPRDYLASQPYLFKHESATMMKFYDFIFYQGLMDLPLVGGTFTWLINWDLLAWPIIDRFLLSFGVGSLFPGVS